MNQGDIIATNDLTTIHPILDDAGDVTSVDVHRLGATLVFGDRDVVNFLPQQNSIEVVPAHGSDRPIVFEGFDGWAGYSTAVGHIVRYVELSLPQKLLIESHLRVKYRT